MTLEEFFQRNPSGALAFSGGTDSSLLVWAAKKYGQDWHAYYVHTAFQPDFELADARHIAAECAIPLTVIEGDILKYTEMAETPAERCYFCKHAVFSMIRRQAAKDGYLLLIDGTNAEGEDAAHPGIKALEELSVRSPLRECGLSKGDIRELSRQAGLFTWNKPSYACLATRISADTQITFDALKAVERGENILSALGFTNFRIRLHGGVAVLRFTQDQFAYAIQRREEICERLQPLFPIVSVDLLPRKGGLSDRRPDTKQDLLKTTE